MNRRIIGTVTALMLFCESVSASVLGTTPISLKSYEISDGTTLYENVFMSDQNGVGEQSEYYAEYVPNTGTVPVVITGESIYGKRTAEQAVQYMKNNGMRPMAGINASFFSFKTGVPMGHVISDGRVMSKDSSTLQSIGFRADGTAFIAPLAIDVTLQTEAGEVGIANVNKFNVATIPTISLYNSDFGAQTRNDVESLSVVLEKTEGELAIGGQVSAKVTDKFVYAGGLAMENNQIILSINIDGNYDYHYNLLNALEIGDEITLKCSANDEIWNEAVHGLGSEGDTLIKNGEVQSGFASGAAPRTAVGITAEGHVIFYVLDGRQKGHSYGAQLRTLAARLAELGCVDAINLDGGGSTSISGVYPGAEEIAVLNSPSEGTLRSVTNFIFLKNVNSRTGELHRIYTTPHHEKFLTGTKVELDSIGLDTAYYSMDAGAVSYSAAGDSVVEGNVLTLNGSGTVSVTASSGNVSTVFENYVYDEPKIVFLANKRSSSSLSLNNGDSVTLSAEAYAGYSKLRADADCFGYEVSGNIGRIENGAFIADAERSADGTITVTAGKTRLEIPVHVSNNDYIFNDMTEHWSREMVREMARRGVVSGYETGNGLVFSPDKNMTRAEFAVMLAKYLDIETGIYGKTDVFDDEIPQWAADSAAALYQLGYISGREDGGKLLFAANDKITRAEAAAMIGRTQPMLSEETDLFTDSAQIPSWAHTFVKRLAAVGVVSGYTDNSFQPGNNVTRAEAVTMLYKLSCI